MIRGTGVATAGWLVLVGCGSAEMRGGPADAGAPDAAVPDVVTTVAEIDGSSDVLGDLRGDAGDVQGASQLAADRADVDFGVFYLGCPRASAVVRLANRGQGSSGPLLATVDDPFRIGSDGCTARELGPGETCDVEIRITAEAPGPLSGALWVWSSPTDAVKVRLAVTAADVVPAFLLSPSALDFPPVAVGQSANKTVTVSVPQGFRPVPKVSAAISPAEFTVSKDGCSGALASGQMCEIEVSFRPAGAGDRSGVLSLSAPAPCPPFQSQVWLRGKGQ